MTPDGILQLVQTLGSATAIGVILLYALQRLHTQLTEVQEKRIADAQLSAAKLLEVVAAQHAERALLARALDGNADALGELRMSLEAAIAERGVHRQLPQAPPLTSPRLPRK